MNIIEILGITVVILLAIFGLVCLISFVRYAYRQGKRTSEQIRTNSKGEKEE